MIASTQTKSTEVFVFAVVVAIKLLSRKGLFMNRTYNRNS